MSTVPEDRPCTLVDGPAIIMAAYDHIWQEAKESGDAGALRILLQVYRGFAVGMALARGRNDVDAGVRAIMGDDWHRDRYEKDRFTKGDEVDKLRGKGEN